MDAGEGIPVKHERRAVRAFERQRPEDRQILQIGGICEWCKKDEYFERCRKELETNQEEYLARCKKELEEDDSKWKRDLEEDDMPEHVLSGTKAKR